MKREVIPISSDILSVEDFFSKETLLSIQAFYRDNDHLFIEMPSRTRIHTLDEYFKGNKKPLYYWVDKNKDKLVDSIFLDALNEIVPMLSSYYGGSIDVVKDSGFRLNKYPIGHGYAYHVDQSNYTAELKERKVSVVFSANHAYTGGELCFPRQNVRCKLKENSFTIFPSNYTHPHEVTPVLSGERLTFVTWLT